MTRLIDIYNYIDEIAPFSVQESYDNSGLILGNGAKEIKSVLIALDATIDVAKEAEQKGVDLLLTHHPVIFKPLKHIDPESVVGRLILSDTAVISAHTSFDSAQLNDMLCEKLSLDIEKPLCVDGGVPIGYVCTTDTTTADDLTDRVKSVLGESVLRYTDCKRAVTRVAVCGGSGGNFLPFAIANNCEAFITGDVKHDIFIDGYNAGVSVIDAGHFHTENIFCEGVMTLLRKKFPDVSFSVAETNRDILSYK